MYLSKTPKNRVTHARVTPVGSHVTVSWCRLKSARHCGVSTNLLGTSYKEEYDLREGSDGMGHLVRFKVVFEDIVKQPFRENFAWMTISDLFA